MFSNCGFLLLFISFQLIVSMLTNINLSFQYIIPHVGALFSHLQGEINYKENYLVV